MSEKGNTYALRHESRIQKKPCKIGVYLQHDIVE